MRGMSSSTRDLRPVLADADELLAAFELDRQWDDLATGVYDDRPAERLDALLRAAMATRRAAARRASLAS